MKLLMEVARSSNHIIEGSGKRDFAVQGWTTSVASLVAPQSKLAVALGSVGLGLIQRRDAS